VRIGQPKPRDLWSDVAKGIAIIGVVMFHAASLAPVGLPHTLWRGVGFGLFLFIMPVFFLVSGIYAARHLDSPFGQYLARRVWPIAYLFIAWTLIYGLIHLVTGGTLGVTVLSSVTLVSTLWFLAALAIYMLVAWLLVRLRIPAPAQVIGAAILATPFAIWLPFQAWGLGHTPHFLVAFLIGTNYGTSILAWSKTAGWRQLGIFATGALVLGVVALIFRPTANVVYALLPVFVVPAVLTVARLASRPSWLAPPLAYIGVQSLIIYLLHPIVQKAFGWGVDMLGVATSPASIAYPAAGTLLAVLISLAVARWLGPVPYLFKAPPLGVRATA
jgi:fucose 4-O-acetylase-like acetyltransferase